MRDVALWSKVKKEPLNAIHVDFLDGDERLIANSRYKCGLAHIKP